MGSVVQTSIGQYLIPGAAGQLRLEEKAIPPPGPTEVQIAPRATTLCGSDIHYFQKGRNGSIEVREPLCLGHESAGVVVAAGPDAQVDVGERVAVECGLPCDSCEQCRAHRYNLCPRLRFRSSGSAWPHLQGTLQTRFNHPAKWVHRLPPELSYEEGALLEPLSVAVHACRRIQVTADSSCTVIGAGAIGLLCAVAARDAGCTRIAMADVVESRVKFAVDNGYADVGHVVGTKRPGDVQESVASAKATAAAIAALVLPAGRPIGCTDYTFECTGVEVCVQTAIYATQRGGRVALVGMGTPNVVIPISEAGAREIDLVPTHRYANCYPQALDILKRSRTTSHPRQLKDLITHRFDGIENVPAALQTACLGIDQRGEMVLKVAVTNTL